MIWSCFVPGEPRATQTGSVVRLPKGRAFPKRRRTEWSNRIALAANAAAPSALLEGPLRLSLTFFRTRPVSAPRRVVYPITRPDLDNLMKGLSDALAGIVYRDDAQVVELVSRKCFAVDGRPGVGIEVEPVLTASPEG